MPQNNKYIIAKRRQEISALYLQGKPQYEIAELVDVNQSQVSRDLKHLKKEWLKSAIRDFDEAKSQELAKIDNLEQEYWDAWEKSKEDYKQTTKRAKGKNEKTTEKEQIEKNVIVFGDPAFLKGVQWCIDKRCKILGIDAPQKIEPVGDNPSAVIILPSNNRDE